MRGASALGALLAEHPAAPARVIVIWEPVIDSDRGPPTVDVRRPLMDPRVVEFWDPERWMSPRAIERATLMARTDGKDPPPPGSIAWDFVAYYPPGVAWQEPFPAAKLRELYGSKREYLRRFETRLDELEKQGWSLPVYHDALVADAAKIDF